MNSNPETNEDSTSQDEYTSSETDEDLESSANISTSDHNTNDMEYQANLLGFRLVILPYSDRYVGTKFCVVISIPPAEIVNRTVSASLPACSIHTQLSIYRPMSDYVMQIAAWTNPTDLVLFSLNQHCFLRKF